MIALAAFAHATAVTQVIGATIAPNEAQLAALAPASRDARSRGTTDLRTTSSEAILKRNPFDSVTGPLDRAAFDGTDPAGASVGMTDPLHAPPCEGVKVLVIAASTDPDWSFAAMTTGSDGKSVLRRRQDAIGGKTVKYVGWDRVWLEGKSGLCQTMLFGPAGSVASPAAAPAASGDAGTVDPSIAKGIQRISATEFNVDRGVVDRILENQTELMRVRIIPEQEKGKMVGLRLVGVRPDTLLGMLGMQNGDRLQTINGLDMTSPENALEAYARLHGTADHLTVQVNRGGQNMNLDYSIK
jgi:general secretion pathway protein C